ncbi:MAG: hypothetical protein GY874_23015 [Desulfobacteraceae bacterium]|nr:hypothetical protein [Desulfobacteraceae bacterium]
MNSNAILIVIGFLFWVLTCFAIVDIARKDFGGIEKKAAWAFVVLIPFLGAIIYFSIGFRKGEKKHAIEQ